jgi:hypothetical protein
MPIRRQAFQPPPAIEPAAISADSRHAFDALADAEPPYAAAADSQAIISISQIASASHLLH